MCGIVDAAQQRTSDLRGFDSAIIGSHGANIPTTNANATADRRVHSLGFAAHRMSDRVQDIPGHSSRATNDALRGDAFGAAPLACLYCGTGPYMSTGAETPTGCIIWPS